MRQKVTFLGREITAQTLGTFSDLYEQHQMTLHETIRAQLHLPAITVHHFGGTVTLTPAQGRAVLAGGELTVKLGKAEVK